MADQWHLSRNNQQFGPYSWHQLVDLFQAGNILPDDMLWNPHSQQWVRSDSIHFSKDQQNLIHHHVPNHRKKVVFLALGVTLIILLCIGIVFSWIYQSKPTYLSGKRGATATMDPKLGPSEVDDTLIQIIDPFEKSIHKEEDFLEWKKFKDLKQEKDSIQKTLHSFTDALKQKNVDGAVKLIQIDRQEPYRELFNSRPEAMESFADILLKSEMSFLSAHSANEPKNRTAEYKVVLDDFIFYVIFMKMDDEWVLYDF